MRLFSSLRLVVATPACEPGQDTSVTFAPRLDHLAPGQLPLLAERSPGATGLASSLSSCFVSQASGAFFDIAGSLEGFNGPCLGRVSSPARTLSLSRLSASFVWLTFRFRGRQSRPAVLIRSSNCLPSVVTAIHPDSKLFRVTSLDSGRFLIVPHRTVPSSRLPTMREHRQRNW